MMNRIDTIGNRPQMAFRANKGNRKAIHEFIDKSSDLAMEILNKDRPLAEKREALLRNTLIKLKIKCPYAGTIIERGKATIELMKDKLFKQ